MAAANDPELTKLALQTYVYGYPLVYCLSEIGKLPAGTSALKYLPRPAIFSGAYALPKVRRLDGPAA